MNVFELEGSISMDTSGFKKSVNDAKKSGIDLAAELRKNAEQIKAMQAQIDKFAEELSKAKAEIDKLKTELGGAAKAADDNADSTADMTDEVNKAKKAMDDAADKADELGKEEKKTKEKTDEYSRSAEKATDKSDTLKKAFHALGSMASDVTGKIGGLASAVEDTIVKAAKVGTVAIGAASTAVGAVTKSAVSAYGEYEQLVGGVETLFGKSANVVLENSEKAFKTAGMSMNDYMETSIQSAAALINSLDGDQAKAAELMDMSIIDMADNVNKMGTNMQSIQNAYRGFSRGNFTMLDNLALGFSGTKEGMQELLDKAHELSGIEYDISSYSDIVKAIHVVQQEMGITGTTSKEAAGTVQGSAGSMKAAWQNLVTSIANPKANLSTAIQDFTASAKVSLNNIMPIVTQALSGVGTLVQELAPVIAEELPNLISTTLPALVGAGTQLVAGIATGLAKAVPQLAPEVKKLVVSVATGIRDNAGTVISGFSHVLRQSVTWLGKNLPAMIDMGKQIISAIAKGFGDNAEEILSSLNDLGVILFDNVIKPAWDFVIYELPDYINTGLRTIDFKGIGEDMSKLVIEGLKGIAYFVDAIDWYQVGADIANAINGIDWKGIIKGVFNLIGSIIRNTPDLIIGVVKSIDFESAIDLITIMFIPKMLASFAAAITASDKWNDIKGALSGKIGEVGDSVEGDEKKSIGFAGKFILGVEAALAGWQIGSVIYEHWGDQIDRLLYPCYDKIAEFRNYLQNWWNTTWRDLKAFPKTAKEGLLDYASEQAEYGMGAKLYDVFEGSDKRNVAEKILDSTLKAKMSQNMANTIRSYISENGYEGALKSGSFDKVKSSYSKYFDDYELLSIMRNTVSDYINTSGNIADKLAFEKYGFNYSGGSGIAAAGSKLSSILGNITKHAIGGVTVNNPVLTTSGDLFGEAGREAILPLDRNTGWMDELANRVNHNSQPMVVQEVNINFPEGLTIGSDYDTDRMIERISEKLEQLRVYQNASTGGVNW